MFKYLLLIIFLSQSQLIQAEVVLKFLSYETRKTKEKASLMYRFPHAKRFHVAVKINDYWYEMLPPRGIVRSKRFISRDKKVITLENKKYYYLEETFVNTEMSASTPNFSELKKMKFNWYSSCNDTFTSNCSKLILQLLDLGVKEQSLSPDEIFKLVEADPNWINEEDIEGESCRQLVR